MFDDSITDFIDQFISSQRENIDDSGNLSGFSEISVDQIISSGHFGQVYKVRDNSERYYAIKKIPGCYQIKNRERILKEIDFLKISQSNYVIKYFGSWHSQNDFYIKMELGESSLKDFIGEKNQIFQTNDDKSLKIIKKFIEVSLIRYCVLCVDYIHNLNPPIIHRDLKPDNYIIVKNDQGYFLKLTDFGLSKYHEDESQTQSSDVGTGKYMAPEVSWSNMYNIKSDIFSLGIISLDILDIEVDFSETRREVVYEISGQLKEMIGSMLTAPFWNRRPSTSQLLQQIESLDEFKIDFLISDKHFDLADNGFIKQILNDRTHDSI